MPEVDTGAKPKQTRRIEKPMTLGNVDAGGAPVMEPVRPAAAKSFADMAGEGKILAGVGEGGVMITQSRKSFACIKLVLKNVLDGTKRVVHCPMRFMDSPNEFPIIKTKTPFGDRAMEVIDSTESQVLEFEGEEAEFEVNRLLSEARDPSGRSYGYCASFDPLAAGELRLAMLGHKIAQAPVDLRV